MKINPIGMLHTGSLLCGSMAILDKGIEGLFSAAVFGVYGTNTLTHLANTQALKAGVLHKNDNYGG